MPTKSKEEDPLFRAYIDTKYVANIGKRAIILEHNRRSPILNKLLLEKNLKSAFFITAWHPMSAPLGSQINTDLNYRLKKYLLKKYKYIFNGAGIGLGLDWAPEHSFLVLGVTYKDALSIAKKFKQAGFGFYENNFQIILTYK